MIKCFLSLGFKHESAGAWKAKKKTFKITNHKRHPVPWTFPFSAWKMWPPNEKWRVCCKVYRGRSKRQGGEVSKMTPYCRWRQLCTWSHKKQADSASQWVEVWCNHSLMTHKSIKCIPLLWPRNQPSASLPYDPKINQVYHSLMTHKSLLIHKSIK